MAGHRDGPRSGSTASGLPARGYTRQPFAKGNAMSVQSGGRSPRVYGELAELLAAGLMQDRPDLAQFPEAVAGWATAEAQAVLFRRHLSDVGPIDENGKPRESTLNWARHSENAAAKHRAVLGLDPRSEAALIRERASATALGVDLAVLAERGRAVLEARATQGIEPPADIAGEVLQRVHVEGTSAMKQARDNDNDTEQENDR